MTRAAQRKSAEVAVPPIATRTGLTRGAIRQIERADRAVALLTAGIPALEVVRRTGYADQPHMTRSLKHLAGRTPTQLTAVSR